MSTDITVGALADDVVEFDAFVVEVLPGIAKAIAVISDHRDAAVDALAPAVASAYANWSSVGFGDEAKRQVFTDAARARLNVEPDFAASLVRAVAIARHQMSWTNAQIALAFDLSPEEVERYLDSAEDVFLDEDPTTSLHHRVRSHVAAAVPAMPDISEIKNQHQREHRRSRRRMMAGAAFVGLLALVALAQLIGRSDRPVDVADVAEDAAPSATATTPRPTVTARAAPVEQAEPAVAMPVPRIVEAPDLITDDGRGGFVGLQFNADQRAAAVFSRSTDGDIWIPVSEQSMGAGANIERFERSGSHYVAFIEPTERSSSDQVGSLGISNDLTNWNIFNLALDERQPYGFTYTPQITDVAVRGDTLLALVDVEIEINFAALLLSESYTCGQTINRQQVTVNLCNESELDVLSVAGIDELPATTRMFVSRAGGAFQRTDLPFAEETAARLINLEGSFVVTDDVGVPFARSGDAARWSTAAAGRLAIAPWVALSGTADEGVGLGTSRDGRTVILHRVGPNISTQLLDELIPDASSSVDARVAFGPSGWLVYVFEPAGNSWLLSSQDAQIWSVRAVKRPDGDISRFLAGDDEAIVQWLQQDGEVTTLVVPVP